jgi:hypothetical protein
MKSLLILCMLFSAGILQAQDPAYPRLVQATIWQHGTVSGDTTYFKHPSGLGKYFNRNLRMPVSGSGYLETGTCELSIIIDTTGKVVKRWMEQGTSKALGNEVLSVAKKIGKLAPTTIKGEPVFTQVKMSFGFYLGEDTVAIKNSETYFKIIGYGRGRN